MVRIREAIVVEGRYDKNTLCQIVDAPILVTEGFGIFKDKEKMNLLRRVAENRGLIVFTDSDGAGFVIRNHIKSAVPAQFLKHAYIPDVYGKEKRKAVPGKEGKLGVEGMRPEVIIESLRRCGATMDDEPAPNHGEITKQDMMALGLSGGKNSAFLREELCRKLALPEKISSNALLQALNLLCTFEEFKSVLKTLELENG